MVNPVLIAAPVTVLPAVGALWYLLKRYEDYFEDARVFLALVFGFFGGMFAAFMEMQAFGIDPTASPGGLAFFVVGYAFFETGCKLVILGTKRFRNRKDTPYYGAALGLGFGAMMALAFVAGNLVFVAAPQYLNGTAINGTGGGSYRSLAFLAMAGVPLGGIFAHGAAGVYIGRAVSEGKLAKGWLRGTLVQIPILFFYVLFWPDIGRAGAVPVLPGLLAIVYGLAMLHFTRTRVLDTIVPQHIKDQVRRDRRRRMRQEARDEEE